MDARGVAIALRVGTIGALLFSACKPRPTLTDPTPVASDASSAGRANANDAGNHGPKHVSAQGESFAIESWSFALDRTNVSIVDLGMTMSLARVVKEKNALLAVNGEFFGTHDEPIGLATSERRVLSKFSPTLSGGVLVIEGDRASLVETESFDAGISSSFAIQCKPRLVVKNAVNVKRDDGKRAERTALCIRDQGKTLDVIVARNEEGGPSLFALATHLASVGCEDALNLDGGPSTGVAFREGGEVREERPRGPLRHAVVLTAR